MGEAHALKPRHTRHRLAVRASLPTVLSVLALCVLLVAPTLGQTEAATATVADSRLPFPARGEAVWTGEHAYVFAWRNATLPGGHQVAWEIIRYTPATGHVATMGAGWTSNVTSARVAWDPRAHAEPPCRLGCAYVLGSGDVEDGTLQRAHILRYDPDADTLATMPTTLRRIDVGAPAAWLDDSILVNRGRNVLRYWPDNGTSVEHVEALPEFRRDHAVIGVEGSLYVLGGEGECAHDQDLVWRRVCLDIVRYDPGTGGVATVGSLPVGNTLTSAVWDGDNVFLVGGWHKNTPEGTAALYRFDPHAGGEATLMSETLPSPRNLVAAVWTGSEIVALGGRVGKPDAATPRAESKLDEIVRYTLEPGPPRDVKAPLTLEPGKQLITWTSPDDRTYSKLTHYRVYRAESPFGVPTLVREVPASQTAYVDTVPSPGLWCYFVTAVNQGRDEGPMAPAEGICVRML